MKTINYNKIICELRSEINNESIYVYTYYMPVVPENKNNDGSVNLFTR